MPLYEYTCKHCGNFEIMQRISEPSLKKCPTCGAKVSKLISLSAFHLKGSGWYMTDYAKNNASKSKEEETKPAADKTEGTTETKTPKSESKDSGPSPTSTTATTASPPVKESAAKESSSTA